MQLPSGSMYPDSIWDLPTIRVPYFGVLIIRILLFRDYIFGNPHRLWPSKYLCIGTTSRPSRLFGHMDLLGLWCCKALAEAPRVTSSLKKAFEP